ncbi:MAG: APC family permease [Gammaproteobacteria bacterium]|nr:APC family permease [Gammaproteobacteria bacterium]
MAEQGREQDEGLLRVIGTGALGLSVVNMVVGAGIFVLPGRVAAQLGSAAILAYLVCSALIVLVFLCFAEIGSRVSRSGGAYAYVEEAFGPFAGFIASTLFWFGYAAISDAAITVAMVETMALAFPVLSETIPRSIFIIALFAFLAIVNVRGVRNGVRLYVLNTVIKIAPLLLLLAAGIFVVDVDNLVIKEWPSPGEIGAGAILLFFAFSGAESALCASGEIRNPARTVPLGLMLGISSLLVLYVGLQTVAQGVLGPELASNTEAPLVAVANEVLGEWGGKMLLVAVVLAIFGAVSGDMLGGPRVIFASALDDNLPRIFARVHPAYRTPHVAIMFYATVIVIFALSGTFKYLAMFAGGALLLVDLGVCLAVLRLRQRDGLPLPGQFRLPLGPVIPLAGCAVLLWLLLQLPADEAISIAILTGAAGIAYALRAVLRRPAGKPVVPAVVPVETGTAARPARGGPGQPQ